MAQIANSVLDKKELSTVTNKVLVTEWKVQLAWKELQLSISVLKSNQCFSRLDIKEIPDFPFAGFHCTPYLDSNDNTMLRHSSNARDQE